MITRIIIVDDHKLLREGLRALITEQPNMAVIAEAEDGRSAVRLVEQFTPDVVIMDISMPGLNGVEATRQLSVTREGVKIICLSMHLDRRMVMAMLDAGARGYLLKDCAFDEVIQAIRAVMDGGVYLSPRIADVVLRECRTGLSNNMRVDPDVLSPREREVVQLLAEGKKSKEVAELLNLSQKTVDSHRLQIMEKLNIRSVAELTKYAIRAGITSL